MADFRFPRASVLIKPWTYTEEYFAARGIEAVLVVLPEAGRPEPGRKQKPDKPNAAYGYTNDLTGLDLMDTLVKRVAALSDTGLRSADLLGQAGVDAKTGSGALFMLDALGYCHCRTGGRSQLVWFPGERAEGTKPPRTLRAAEYHDLMTVMRKSSHEWLAIDHLATQAGFGFDSSSLKRARGALKVLITVGLARHDKYGRQAVVLQWAGDGGSNHPVYNWQAMTPRAGRMRGSEAFDVDRPSAGWAALADDG